jgi:hypothetical protein
MHRYCLAILFCSPLLAIGPIVFAAEPEWGHLTGRFLYDGAAPPSKLLPVPPSHRDKIGGKDVPDESLIVGEESGLANVFVWLRPAIGEKPPVHPSYADTEEGAVELVARDLRLQPHALCLRTSQTLLFRHEDPGVGYSLTFASVSNAPRCDLVPSGKNVSLEFDQSERLPIDIRCSIHPWIHGRILVVDHPYAAVTGSDGRFVIRNLPVGKWEFVAWHEKAGYIKQPKIDGRQLEWERGTFEHEIVAGDNSLGDVRISPKSFRLQ